MTVATRSIQESLSSQRCNQCMSRLDNETIKCYCCGNESDFSDEPSLGYVSVLRDMSIRSPEPLRASIIKIGIVVCLLMGAFVAGTFSDIKFFPLKIFPSKKIDDKPVVIVANAKKPENGVAEPDSLPPGIPVAASENDSGDLSSTKTGPLSLASPKIPLTEPADLPFPRSGIPKEGSSYAIKPGDTIARIARAVYNAPELYRAICTFNAFSDDKCNRIDVGDVINLPIKSDLPQAEKAQQERQ